MDTQMVEATERMAASQLAGAGVEAKTVAPETGPVAEAGGPAQRSEMNNLERGSVTRNAESEADSITALGAMLREEFQRGLEALRNEIARGSSPWMCANSAARYADCSPSMIFKIANQGLIKRYDGVLGPRFNREEIDVAISKGAFRRKTTSSNEPNPNRTAEKRGDGRHAVSADVRD